MRERTLVRLKTCMVKEPCHRGKDGDMPKGKTLVSLRMRMVKEIIPATGIARKNRC